jgi:hypothetical protein
MSRRERGARPRAKTMVRLDLHNAYARLGVSPLMTTEEIKAAALRKRKEILAKRKQRVVVQQLFGEEEAEMADLQKLESLIGTPKGRARYDQANPQNELLTVQPSPRDRLFDPRYRAGLVTAWLVEELGAEAPLPSPDCLAFWAPGGHAAPPSGRPGRREATAGPQGGAAAALGEGDAGALPGVEELVRLAKAPRPDGDPAGGDDGQRGGDRGDG